MSVELRPTRIGFIRKYCCSLVPLFLLAGYAVIPGYPMTRLFVFTLATLTVITASWAARSREALGSTGLFLLLSLLLVFPDFSSPVKILARTSEIIVYTAPAASLATLVSTELYRRTIKYTIGDNAVVLEGGIIRRQKHVIPYQSITRVVLEQSFLGRLFGYGTVILVTPGFGEELYTRAVGVGVLDGAGGGAGYARTLVEVSRDPLKVLYAVPKPEEVLKLVEEKITHTRNVER